MTAEAPWVDRTEYPFRSRYLEHPDGRLHYVDEGEGPVVVMVHGTPTWSFLYRKLIRNLSARHRVVAVDHLGFGLSDKPEKGPYRPEDHARRLATLIERLGLRDVTLVVHDFGGPIGLSYAVEHPDDVRALVLFNTWMWSMAGDPATERVSRIMGGALGRFLYRRLNFSPRVLIPSLFGDRKKLTREAHRHYLAPFPSARERMAPWVLARELIGSSAWYDSLWQRGDRIRDKPALILWGGKDPAFGRAFLERWRERLPGAEVVEFPSAGHFVQEEEAVSPIVERFLAGVAARGGGG